MRPAQPVSAASSTSAGRPECVEPCGVAGFLQLSPLPLRDAGPVGLRCGGTAAG